MRKTKLTLFQLIAELDRRDIGITTDGTKVFFDLPKGTQWEDLHEAILAYKPALIDIAGQRESHD